MPDAHCVAYDRRDPQSGHCVASEALQPASTATTVRVRNGKVAVTDGPFAETKEFLAGFYMIEARDLNEAIQLAARIPPAAVGSIEVRPIRPIRETVRAPTTWRTHAYVDGFVTPVPKKKLEAYERMSRKAARSGATTARWNSRVRRR